MLCPSLRFPAIYDRTTHPLQVLDFLLSRPEVTKVTWNSKDFLPPVGEDEL